MEFCIMMTRTVWKIKLPLIVICFFSLAGCEDFIERSLEGKSTRLLAPGHNIESAAYQQTFWWETQIDALHYRLQIVNPNFDTIAKLVLDTLVTGDKVLWTLEPGEYEWRIRPENGSSAGVFQKRKLTIFPSSIKNQQVQLNAPGVSFTTLSARIQFSWVKLFGAENYRFQLDDKGFTDDKTLLQDVVTDNLNYLYNVPKEGIFQWRVRAEGAETVSSWSPVRTIVYDNTPPVKVLLKAPTNKQSVSKPVKLSWESISDAYKYEVAMYNADSSLLSGLPQMVAVNSFTSTYGAAGEKVLWRVRAVDKVGNAGPFSDYFSYTIQ